MKFLGLLAIATAVFFVQWAIASFFTFLGLNYIADFGFNFTEIIGIGYVIAATRTTVNFNS